MSPVEKTYKAMLARDIIDMSRDFPDNYEIAAHLSDMCFSLSLIFRNDPSVIIDWDELAGILDKREYQLHRNEKPVIDEAALEKIWRKADGIIRIRSVPPE